MNLFHTSKVKNETKNTSRLTWRGVALVVIPLILIINAFLLFKVLVGPTLPGQPKGRLLFTAAFVTYSMNMETGEKTLLLEEADQYTRGTVSPDGVSIARIRGMEGEENKGFSNLTIYTTRWAGGAGWHSLGKFLRLSEVSWTSDSQWLLYNGYAEDVMFDDLTHKPDLWMVRADTGERQQITDTPYGEYGGVVSPDGTQFAYLADSAGPDSLRLMVLDTKTRQSHVILQDQESRELVWSPDSQWIAFTSEVVHGGNRDVWIVRPDGTEAHAVTHTTNVFGDESYREPIWLP